MAILYVAADARELKGFESFLSATRKLKWPLDYAVEGILDGRRVLLAANGAGPKLAAQAVEIAIRAVTAAELSSSRLEAVVSTGFCGALTSAAREGDILAGSEVLDSSSNARYPCSAVESDPPAPHGIVLSQDRVAVTAAEKTSLAATGALAVEMESAGAAARTARAGLPFSCIKVVSDRLDETFRVDLNSMRDQNGRIARGKIGVYACSHPWLIPELFRWKRRADLAAQALGAFLVRCRIHVGGNSKGENNSSEVPPD